MRKQYSVALVFMMGLAQFTAPWLQAKAQTAPAFAPSTSAPPASTVYAISAGKTPGGISLVHLQIPEEKDQAFSFYWTDREIQHMPEKAGLLVLAPGLISIGGAGALDSGALEEELKDLGGFFSLSRGRSTALGDLFAPREQIEAVARLLQSALSEPRLPEITLTRRKRFLLNGLKASREKAENLAREALNLIVVGDHPIARTIHYLPQSTITDVSVADIEAWRKSVLRRGLTIVAAGPLRREEAAALVDSTFGSLPEGTSTRAAIPLTLQSLAKTIVIERNVEQSVILSGAGVQWRSGGAEGISRNLAMNALGGSNRSQLFIAIREKLGAAYGASSSISSLLGRNSLFAMEASVANDKVGAALAAMRNEYQLFREKGVTAESIDPVKRRMISGFPDSMRKAGSAASIIRTGMINDLGPDAANQYQDWVREQTPERINSLIRERLPEALTTIIVTPSAQGLGADCVIRSIDELPRCQVP
ncbi:MAG: M16 family metallopeptidase [Beijerinckiaceae bacterium]